MKFRNALLAASFLALPVVASAQPVTGIYVGAGVGVDLHIQEQIKNLSLGSGTFGGLSTSGENKFNPGFAGEGSMGYGFGNGLRIELEGDYTNNSSNGFTGGSRGFPVAGGGTEEKYGFMGNVLYDFFGLSPMFVPYVGAGVGMQWVNWQNFHAYNTGAVTGGGFTANPYALDVTSNNDTKGVFAYQGIVGFAVPIPAVPGLAITADYRYLGTSGDRSTSSTYTATTSTGTKVSGGGNVQFGPTGDNIIMVGFRYNFGQTPPPPPAAPAPAPAPAVQPARSYLVFFDWDKATLTDRARSIIKEAADNSTHVQYTRIEVNGYTDTSGTPQYNQGLSVRRAQAVAAELVHDGVPRTAITAQGFGETHLLVPTGPGVREPQNRRVEIIIH